MEKIQQARELFAKLEGQIREEVTIEDVRRKFRILELMRR